MKILSSVLVLLFVVVANVTAQTGVADSTSARENFFARTQRIADRIIEWRDRNPTVDTAYVQPLASRWMFTTSFNGAASSVEQNGTEEGDIGFHTELWSKSKYSFGLGARYRGLGASVSFNPFNVLGKNRDYDLTFNYYGECIGFDLMYNRSHTLHGRFEVYVPADTVAGTSAQTLTEQIPQGTVGQRFLAANAYYAFNGHRFSYAAAYDHTCLQRRSCGSILLGGSLMDIRVRWKYDESADDGSSSMTFRMAYFGLGAGYAHNFVIRDRWLINVSGLSELVIVSHGRLDNGLTSRRFPRSDLPVIFVGRAAFVRHFKHSFVALTVFSTIASIGKTDQLQMTNTKLNWSLIYGVKF